MLRTCLRYTARATGPGKMGRASRSVPLKEFTRFSSTLKLPEQRDLVFVKDLQVKALTGLDAWSRQHPQPVSISVFLDTSIAKAGSTDHLEYSLNYDLISRTIMKRVEESKFESLEDLAEAIAETLLSKNLGGQSARIQVSKPRCLLRAGSAEIELSRSTNADFSRITKNNVDTISIHQLQLVTVIGVNIVERLHKQNVILDLKLFKENDTTHYDFRKIVDTVSDYVENSRFKTVEALVCTVADIICSLGVDKVTVRVEKPSAITFAAAAGVEVTRSRHDHEPHFTPPPTISIGDSQALFPDSGEMKDGTHTAFIAFGSNVGDTFTNVLQAIEAMKENGINIVATSGLYESEPMFVTDQSRFLNGVVKISTDLKPSELLTKLQRIESEVLKREKLIEKGPRSIDLDILLFDDLVLNTEHLTIPHAGMLSRSFVLRPLMDVASPGQIHPLTAEPFKAHYDQLPESSNIQTSSALTKVIPIPGSHEPLRFSPGHSLATIQAVLNVTPDSFSDGGSFGTEAENIVEKALKQVKNGASILDIGGMSTNPKSVSITVEEELKRVVPAIEALRSCELLNNIPISIDTFRFEVAEAALKAGANIINDISSGQLSNGKMFELAAATGAPIILNHTRGDPQSMDQHAIYELEGYETDSDEAVVEIVGRELEDRVQEALSANVKGWQIILDPGIGFAKKEKHNLALIRNFSKLANRSSLSGHPWLVGVSRKRFIGSVTDEPEAANRTIGTAVTVAYLANQGTDISRVHDVKEAVQAIKMMSAIVGK